jgi:beta-lactamase regulating signal transducer with metallopeptidase domain
MVPLLHVGLANAALAAVLAVIAAVVGRLSRRPALAHGLWLLVLLKLITPPLVNVPIPLPVEQPPPLAAESRERPENTSEVPLPPALPLRHVDVPATVPRPVSMPASQPRAEPTPAADSPSQGGSWEIILIAVWLTGSLLWWMLAGIRTVRFSRLLRQAPLAPDELQAHVQRLASRLGLARPPSVRTIDAPLAPLLWALGRSPCLLLPTELWDRLTEEQREALLVHELAHLRRGDHWVRRLELVVLGLYWWHPVVWWARRELQETEEQCCDAWVTWALPEAGPAYAAALVETVAFLSQARFVLPLGASGGGPARRLKRRLTMILRGPSTRTLTWGGLFLIVGLALGLLPLMPTWAQQSGDEPEGRVPKPAPLPRLPPARPIAQQDPTQPRPAEPARAPLQRARAEERERQERRARIEELRDEVELLEAGMRVKRAQVQAAQIVLKGAEERFALIERLDKGGTISQQEVAKAREDVSVRRADVLIKEAELREAEVRLKQAQRRLKALEEPPARQSREPGASAREEAERKTAEEIGRVKRDLERAVEMLRKEDSNKRIEDLSRKLEELRRELEELRRSLRPDRPTPPPPRKEAKGEGEPSLPVSFTRPTEVKNPDGPVFYSNSRTFEIPFQVDPQRQDSVKQLRFYVRKDSVEGWWLAGTVSAEEKRFRFEAPKDGSYVFVSQSVDGQGRGEGNFAPGTARGRLTVVVDTVRPEINLKTVGRVAREGGKAEYSMVEWRIREDNPDLQTFTLEYLEDKAGDAWKPVKIEPKLVGGATFRMPEPGKVRLRMKDLAGNVGEAQIDVP